MDNNKVKVRLESGEILTGIITGLGNDFPTVTIEIPNGLYKGVRSSFEVAWSTIQSVQEKNSYVNY